MADRWAVATGNWSNTATWNGGTLPTAADDVFADGFTVTIDQNVTVLSIRTTQRSGGTAGGGFTLNAGFNVTADIRAGTTNCLSRTATGASSAIVGTIYGSDTNAAAGMSISGGFTVTVTGSLIPGLNNSGLAISVNSSTLVVNSNLNGRAGSSAYVIFMGGTGPSLTVNGNVHNTSGTSAIVHWQASGGIFTVNGLLRGTDSGSISHGIWVSANSCTMIVNGNIEGGLATNGANGNIVGTVYGDAVARLANAFVGTQCTVFGNCTSGSTGVQAVSGRLLINPSGTIQHSLPTNVAGNPSTFRTLYTGGVNIGQPVVTNVRSGTVYGASNEFTGTCAVPPAGSVALGVPVDNTTGTGLINQTVLQSALEAALAPNAANIVERSTNDNKAITFSWPVNGATITGQKSIDNGAYSAVVGAITFLRTESNRHYYALAYNAADRNTVESSIRYKMTDGTYTKYFNLHVVPSGDVDVVVTPLQAVVDQMIRGTRIEVPLGYTGTVGPVVVTDTSNNPIDISAPSELIISKKWRGDILVIPDGSITRSGAGNNQFTISASGATLIPGEHAWALRRLSDKFVFAKGDWVVKQTATKD